MLWRVGGQRLLLFQEKKTSFFCFFFYSILTNVSATHDGWVKKTTWIIYFCLQLKSVQVLGKIIHVLEAGTLLFTCPLLSIYWLPFYAREEFSVCHLLAVN